MPSVIRQAEQLSLPKQRCNPQSAIDPIEFGLGFCPLDATLLVPDEHKAGVSSLTQAVNEWRTGLWLYALAWLSCPDLQAASVTCGGKQAVKIRNRLLQNVIQAPVWLEVICRSTLEFCVSS